LFLNFFKFKSNFKQVRWHSFNGRHMLKANCDGTVLITRENCNPDPNIKIMEDLYGFRFLIFLFYFSKYFIEIMKIFIN